MDTNEQNEQIVYQLKADGIDCFNGHYRMHTTTLFTTIELAEKRLKRFREYVCDPVHPIYAKDDEHLKITIEPLTIVE